MSGVLVADRSWITKAFLVNNNDLEDADAKLRFFSTVSIKFTNTTPGGNLEVNPLPQFTKYADLPPAANTRIAGGDPMGRYYSENFDDNAQRIYMRFGHVQFNSMWTFFSNFYNINAGRIARTGRGPGIAYTLGRLAGMVVPLFFPKLLVVSFLGYAGRFFLDKPSSKYCFLKPSMPLYWHAVQTIVNGIAVNMGVVDRALGDDVLAHDKSLPGDYANTKKLLQQAFPDVFTEKGTINVFAYANKAQRLYHKQQTMLENVSSTGNSSGVWDDLKAVYTKALSSHTPDWDAYLNRWVNNKTLGQAGNDPALGDLSVGEKADKEAAKSDTGFFDFFKAELDDGAAFATFRVNYTGAVSESFSSTVGDSDIANKINGMAAQGRSTNFSLMGGNLGDGMAAKAIQGVFSMGADLIKGIADGTALAGLGVVSGGAFADIPKNWQASSATFNKSSYTVMLTSPYNNPISQLFNIVTPLAMLLAGVLPLSTGRQSYTAPFHLEMYDRGRCQTRFGMIESMTIQRGVGNTGWSRFGQALGIEVTFSIVDMTSIMHMPIASAFSMNATEALGNLGTAVGGVGGAVVGGVAGGTVAGPGGAIAGAGAAGTAGAAIGNAGGMAAGALIDTGMSAASTIGSLFDDETVFSDYMATLGGLGLADQIYPTRRLKLRLTKLQTDWSTWLSSAHFASVMGDGVGGRLMSALYKGNVR